MNYLWDADLVTLNEIKTIKKQQKGTAEISAFKAGKDGNKTKA